MRFVASWDAFKSDWQRAELDAYMRAARAANVKVLLGFGRSRDPKLVRKLPSVRAYEREFQKFRARYPDVDEFIAWNEANHCSQPTCRHPKRAAQFYLAARRHCRGCTIVGASLLDSSNMAEWAKRLPEGRGRHERRIIWGLHNYIDANLFRTRGTRALLKAVKGDIWFTETGGIVKRNNKSTLKFPESTRNAAKATTLRVQAGGALVAGQARVLLPLGPGPDDAPDVGLRARRPALETPSRLQRPLLMAATARHRALLEPDRGGVRARAAAAARPPRAGSRAAAR